jgi:hypothetical protein
MMYGASEVPQIQQDSKCTNLRNIGESRANSVSVETYSRLTLPSGLEGQAKNKNKPKKVKNRTLPKQRVRHPAAKSNSIRQ